MTTSDGVMTPTTNTATGEIRAVARMTPELRDAAELTARTIGVGFSEFVRLALAEAIDRHGPAAAYSFPMFNTKETR